MLTADEPTIEPIAYQRTSSAHDEAFEQFVENEHRATDWFAHCTRRALPAMPLLLVLALERAVARKSRRASTAVASHASWLPRFSRRGTIGSGRRA
jgi:hypothetical protein